MTPDELDAMWAEAGALLAYVDTLRWLHAEALWRQNHLRAVVTELSHHGDMTPTAKRVLLNVLDGAE